MVGMESKHDYVIVNIFHSSDAFKDMKGMNTAILEQN